MYTQIKTRFQEKIYLKQKRLFICKKQKKFLLPNQRSAGSLHLNLLKNENISTSTSLLDSENNGIIENNNLIKTNNKNIKQKHKMYSQLQEVLI